MIEYSSSSSPGQTSTTSSNFYIPLENLLIDISTLNNPDAPKLSISGVEKQLCILKSGQVSSDSHSSGPYNYPSIVLGTMALNSIYFAADFASGSVGLSSKLNATQSAFYATGPASSSYCLSPASCIGDQIYNAQTNVCKEPSCVNYFFVDVDPVTQTCHYTKKSMGWGLFFLIVISAMEIVSFFTTQHTTFSFYRTYLEGQGIQSAYGYAPFLVDANDAENGNNPEQPAQVMVKLDIISRLLGPPITKAVDWFVIHVLGWSVAPDPHRIE